MSLLIYLLSSLFFFQSSLTILSNILLAFQSSMLHSRLPSFTVIYFDPLFNPLYSITIPTLLPSFTPPSCFSHSFHHPLHFHSPSSLYHPAPTLSTPLLYHHPHYFARFLHSTIMLFPLFPPSPPLSLPFFTLSPSPYSFSPFTLLFP